MTCIKYINKNNNDENNKKIDKENKIQRTISLFSQLKEQNKDREYCIIHTSSYT